MADTDPEDSVDDKNSPDSTGRVKPVTPMPSAIIYPHAPTRANATVKTRKITTPQNFYTGLVHRLHDHGIHLAPRPRVEHQVVVWDPRVHWQMRQATGIDSAIVAMV